MTDKLYFGHAVNTYNTPLEEKLMKIIAEKFPDFEIENPNQPHHDEAYLKWKKEKGNGMKYYFEEVLPKMDAGVFLPFEDGMFGAGVYGEAEFIYKSGKPIFQITNDGTIANLKLTLLKKLSIEETRQRVYGKK